MKLALREGRFLVTLKPSLLPTPYRVGQGLRVLLGDYKKHFGLQSEKVGYTLVAQEGLRRLSLGDGVVAIPLTNYHKVL